MNVRINGSGLVEVATLRSPTKLTHSGARVVQGSGLQSKPFLTKQWLGKFLRWKMFSIKFLLLLVTVRFLFRRLKPKPLVLLCSLLPVDFFLLFRKKCHLTDLCVRIEEKDFQILKRFKILKVWRVFAISLNLLFSDPGFSANFFQKDQSEQGSKVLRFESEWSTSWCRISWGSFLLECKCFCSSLNYWKNPETKIKLNNNTALLPYQLY